MVEAVRRAQQPTHGASAKHDHGVGIGVAVPEDREEAAHREDLEVANGRADHHLLAGQRLQQVEGPGHWATGRPSR